jgi:hypothetical protein
LKRRLPRSSQKNSKDAPHASGGLPAASRQKKTPLKKGAHTRATTTKASEGEKKIKATTTYPQVNNRKQTKEK